MTTNTPLSIPLEAWPEIDRRLWETGRTSGYLASQKPTSIAEIVNGYGRWLSFLASRGDLDERTDAAGRVTSDRVRNYIDAMDYKNTTIETRLLTLGAALRVLAPDRSFTWLHPWNLLRGQYRRGPRFLRNLAERGPYADPRYCRVDFACLCVEYNRADR
jgi:hypothetical protein